MRRTRRSGSRGLNLRAAVLSSNLARKKRRLDGNRETGETLAEETKTAKLLTIQDFPVMLKKEVDMAERGGIRTPGTSFSSYNGLANCLFHRPVVRIQ